MAGTRQAILREAKRLIQRRGLEGMTMRMVAKRVGVSATAIYRHFEDKEVLLRNLADEGFERLKEYMDVANSEPKAEGRVWRLMERFLDFALVESEYFAFMFLVPGSHVRRFPDDFAAQKSPTARILVEQVEQCMREGVFREDDPLETALTIWAHAHGLIALHRTDRFSGDEALFREIYFRSLGRMLNGLRRIPKKLEGGE